MKTKKAFKYFFVAILLIFFGYFSTKYFSSRSDNRETKETAVNISNENTPGRVLGEEENQIPSQSYSSRNFRSPEISFGGSAITVPSGEQALDPEIVDLRSELLTTKRDGEAKFLISWKTTKPCVSSIAYKKEGETREKMISENDFGYLHSAALSPLAFSTSYSYLVSAKDRWGNVASADKMTFYTGAPNISILDFLVGAFRDMFGWAGR